MRASSLFLAFSILLLAAGAAAWVAVFSADWLEARSLSVAESALAKTPYDWAVVDTDGLQVRVSGIADSEADRFAVLSALAKVIDGSRIIDRMDVVEPEPPAPKFAIEILRDDKGMSLIGLVPASFDTAPLLKLLGTANRPVTDLLQTADFPIPAGFEVAADFGARAALRLKRAKISVSADRVSVQATAETPEARSKALSDLRLLASDSFVLALDIRAPRPVATPFALRFLRDGKTGSFDVCTADSPEARDAITRAAVQAGLSGKVDCTVALGAPSPEWGPAAVKAIDALARIGSGSVTFRDADVSLVAAPGTKQATFDAVVGALRAALPEPFSLHAVLKKVQNKTAQVAEFSAKLAPDGSVSLAGKLDDDATAEAITGFATARFGTGKVKDAVRKTRGLPEGWPVRVLAALDALSKLHSGSVEVTQDHLALKGVTGSKGAKAAIASLLADKLGDGGSYTLDVTYDKRLDPLAALPTPEECLARVKAVQKGAKITFDPGKASIDKAGLKIVDKLAQALTDCENVTLEVAGYTDSQGRESMNLSLSQTRAEAVIDALLARRVLTGNLVAKGYGEADPIAPNDTEAGREANRRIEFHLLTPEQAQADRQEAKAQEASAADPATGATATDLQGGTASNEQN